MQKRYIKRYCAALFALILLFAGYAFAAAPPLVEAKDPAAAARQLVLKGLSQAVAGNLDKAIELYTKAIELDPRYARAYDFRGAARAKKGELDKALEDFNKAVSIHPDYPEYMDVYYSRGQVYIRKGLYDKAIEDFTKAIALKPDFAGAFHARATAHKGKGLPDKAAEDLRTACKMGHKQACEEGGAAPRKGK